MIIIFMFSMQNGNESSKLSLGVIEIIQSFIPISINIDTLHFIIRKAAHMSEYALLCLSFIYGFSKNAVNKYILYSLLCTFLYACTDEFHQLFIGGRAGQFTDVLIDTSGGLIMVVLIIVIKKIKQYN